MEENKKKKAHPYSKTSLVLALFFWVPALNIFTSILSIVFGVIALREIKGDQKGRGFAIAGITISIVTIFLSFMGFILYPELYLGQNYTMIKQ